LTFLSPFWYYHLLTAIEYPSLSCQFVSFLKETSIQGVFSVGQGWAGGGYHMTSERISPVWGTILLTIAIFSLSLPVFAKYGGGTGEPDDPYLIYTAEQMDTIGTEPNNWDKHFVLMADIDLSEYSGRLFNIIGTSTTGPFTGVFDGNNHTISNFSYRILDFNYTSKGRYVGLFGYVQNSIIKDIGLIDPNLNGQYDVGSLVGFLDGGTVTGCYVDGGAVKGWEYIGGLVGRNSGCVFNCSSTSEITGIKEVGGLMGRNSGCVFDCYSVSNVFGEINYVGGLIGANHGRISNSFSISTISGKTSTYVGGLLGVNYSSVSNCYSSGSATGGWRVGGLVGGNDFGFFSIISNCYSTSTVTGDWYIGGLLGSNSGMCSVSNCYSTGTVIGDYNVGGLVGDNNGAVSKCFWDMQTSGAFSSDGGTGLTTEEIQDVTTYINAGWDIIDETVNGTCDYWQVLDGNYPQLSYFVGSGPKMPEGLGTVQQPYLIRDASDLGSIYIKPNAQYRLESSLDLSDIKWSTAVIPNFDGTFDGNGYIISNLSIEGEDHLGLFGQLGPEALIYELGLEAVDVKGTGVLVCGLVVDNNGSVSNCYSNGTVNGFLYVGVIVAHNRANVSKSYSTGTVAGEQHIGGIIGENIGSVSNCYNTGSVTGSGSVGNLYDIGGLVGTNDGSISNCYSTGTVTGEHSVGGLVGGNGGSVSTSFWDIQTSGLASSDGGVGLTTSEMMDPEMLGLNGLANDPNWVVDSYRDYPHLAWEGTAGEMIHSPNINWIEGNGTHENPFEITNINHIVRLSKAGVLFDKYFMLTNDLDLSELSWEQAVIPNFSGRFDGNGYIISNLQIRGQNHLGLFGHLGTEALVCNLGLEGLDINGNANIGGLAGRNEGNITASYSNGTIHGGNVVGGLVGRNKDGNIIDSYSRGTVSGKRDIGGLVGFNYRGSIILSYSTSTVNGNEDFGGLVGDHYEGNTSHSFWDIQTSGRTWSDGGIGKTTAEMQTASTFLEAGWDFVDEIANGTEDIWWINEGQDYPRLWWEAEGN
jgi:hypothetical protein